MTYRCRLYLITPPRIDDVDAFLDELDAALDGGDVACLQIRLKDADGTPASDEHICHVSQAILPMAQGKDVAVLINDRPDLAAKVGADGVHVGQEDASIKDARKHVGPDGIVGATCHDSRHLAMVAGEQGADYVAFGAFFETSTKTPKSRASTDLLTWWQEMMELPCVAIGGVTVETAPELVRAGADFLAVSSGVWNHPDGPRAAVKAFNDVFDAVARENEADA